MKELIAQKHTDFVSNVLFYVGGAVIGIGCSNIFSLQGYLVLIGSIFLLFSILFKFDITVSKTTILIAIFGLAYSFFYCTISRPFFASDLLRNLIYTVFVPTVFSLVLSRDGFNYRKVLFLMLCMVFGLAIQGLLLILSSYLYLGSDFNGGSLVSFFEEGGIARTSLQIMIFPLIGLSFAFFLQFNQFRRKTLFVVLCVFLVVFDAVTLAAGLTIGNRAIYVALVFQLLLVFVFVLLKIKNKSLKFGILAGTAVVFGIVFCFFFGLIPVPAFLARIPLIGRFLSGGSDSLRIKLYLGFLSNFWRYPFGGLGTVLSAIDAPYVHNFILDIYTYGGVFPFCIFLLLCIYFAKNIFIDWKRNKGICIYIVFLTSGIFFLGLFEPLFQANDFYFCIFAFIFSEASVLAAQPRINICTFKRVTL